MLVGEDPEVAANQRVAAGRVASWFEHELKSLLGVLRQAVAQAPDGGPAPTDAEAAARVQAAARACSTRASALLGLRPEPKLAVGSSPRQMLAALLAQHPALRQRTVQHGVIDDRELPLSTASLRSVMKALLDNACEAAAGPPEVTLGASDGSPELWVKSAAPMSARATECGAFPFFSEKAGHAGLGLSLAYVAADNQGGRLEIVPDGGGTRVGITFANGRGATRPAAVDADISFACHLSAMLAHDLNNALMAALGWAEILGDARDEAERQEALSTLSQAGDYLEAMSYLLPFEQTSRPLGPPLDLGEAIERMRPLLRAVLDHKADRKIALCVGSVQGARVPMSEDALRSVVLRLASNARDAMPGGGTWTISCAVKAPELLVTVSAAARGTDALGGTARPAPPSTLRQPTHHGALGLAVVRDLVQAAGGSLELEVRSPAADDPQTSPIPPALIRLPGAEN